MNHGSLIKLLRSSLRSLYKRDTKRDFKLEKIRGPDAPSTEQTSLTNSALEIIHEMGYKWTKIAGPQFLTYKGKTLYDLNQED